MLDLRHRRFVLKSSKEQSRSIDFVGLKTVLREKKNLFFYDRVYERSVAFSPCKIFIALLKSEPRAREISSNGGYINWVHTI